MTVLEIIKLVFKLSPMSSSTRHIVILVLKYMAILFTGNSTNNKPFFTLVGQINGQLNAHILSFSPHWWNQIILYLREISAKLSLFVKEF